MALHSKSRSHTKPGKDSGWRYFFLIFFLVACKTSSTGGASTENTLQAAPAEIPPECQLVKREAEKVANLLADYTQAAPEAGDEQTKRVSDNETEDLALPDPEKEAAASTYRNQLDQLAQTYEHCVQRASSRGEDCPFPGSVRSSADEPCQCYRNLTDEFKDGIPIKTAAADSVDCLEHFAKTSQPMKKKLQPLPTPVGDRAAPESEEKSDRNFAGCLCGASGNECLMWRPEEKVAESWLEGPCTPEVCHLLSRQSSPCALLYRMVQAP